MRCLCTHNQYFEKLDDLRDAIFDKIREWHSPNTCTVMCSYVMRCV